MCPLSRSPRVLAVLADTHLGASAALPATVSANLSQADIVVHAGDFTSPSLLHELLQYREFHGVCGNSDSPQVCMQLPPHEIFSVQGYRIGVVHGWGPRAGLEQRVIDYFQGCGLDVLIYGHSHLPVCRHEQGLWLINPGSPTQPRQTSLPSMARITLTDQVRTEIITIPTPAAD